MKPRVVVWLIVVVVLMLSVSLGTARAHQVWSENQAHSGLIRAESAASRTMARASGLGLTAAELAPYRQVVNRLQHQPPPQSSPLWGGGLAGFYDRQARAYSRLIPRLHRAVARVTAETHRAAETELSRLGEGIAQARSLDIDVTAASAALGRERASVAAAHTPRESRAAASAVAAIRRPLAAAISTRTSEARAALSRSGNTLTGVLRQADESVASAQPQLSLLGLFSSRAAVYQATLDRLAAAVRGQKTPFGAAVKETELESEMAALRADYNRTVPAKVILVSTEAQWAHMYQNGQEVYSSPVTTGGPELPTDHGVFHIYFKASPFVFHSPWPADSPYYYSPTPVTYWMPFDGGEGLHDASWRSNFGPGSNVAPTDLGGGRSILGTHGCVNLPYDTAQWVWNWAPVGTAVVVI